MTRSLRNQAFDWFLKKHEQRTSDCSLTLSEHAADRRIMCAASKYQIKHHLTAKTCTCFMDVCTERLSTDHASKFRFFDALTVAVAPAGGLSPICRSVKHSRSMTMMEKGSVATSRAACLPSREGSDSEESDQTTSATLAACSVSRRKICSKDACQHTKPAHRLRLRNCARRYLLQTGRCLIKVLIDSLTTQYSRTQEP